MKFFQVVCQYQYLHSPKTWLHKKYHNVKVTLFLFHLLLIPHVKLYYLIISSVTISIILFSLKLNIEIQTNMFKTLLFCFLTLSINGKNQSVDKRNLYKTRVGTYKFNIESLYKTLVHRKLEVEIPELLLRTLLISYIYIISIKIMMLTIKYEKIVTSITLPMRQLKHHVIQDVIFTTILGLQFLDTLSTQVTLLYIAYKIRGQNCNIDIYYSTRIKYLFVKDFFIVLAHYITALSSSLHNRDINLQNLHCLDVCD
uniref:Transmembrane protein n=1 Tax=Renouxia sp. TaxID=2485823 RepID=A0A3G3MHK3_9FLOR|nr:hypothetical protein [Renouxia sp.]